MRDKRQNIIKVRPTFSIICEGECELWYFQMLRRNERALNLHLKPEIPQKKKLKDQFELVKENSNNYDKVYWIIDFDVVHNESRETPKGKFSALNELKNYCNQLEVKHKNVRVIINNPCLEFWFLLHFEVTGKFFKSCDEAGTQFKKYLPDYEKTQKYFTQNYDIYKKLKFNLNIAIENAKKLKSFTFENPNFALSEMFLLFEDAVIKEAIK